MKEIIKKHLIVIILTTAGVVGGFLYWKFVGCSSGTCFIKSRWYMMTLYGALTGYLAGSLVEDFIVRRKKRNSTGEGI